MSLPMSRPGVSPPPLSESPSVPLTPAPRERLYVLVVLAGVLLANLGVWNAGVPFGDEAAHVLRGFAILHGEPETNLYHLAYAALLSGPVSDPIVAHLILRFAISVASTLGLYYLLRAFRAIRPGAAAVASLAWAASGLCTPGTQDSPSHVFCLALMLPALGYLLRRPGAVSIILFALAAFVTSRIRPEYLAPFLLVPLGGAWLVRARARAAGDGPPVSNRGARFRLRVAAMALVAALSYGLSRKRPHDALSFDSYLLLGLGQSYAVYYKDRHPDEKFEPMTEYVPLLNRVFGHPHTFLEALANNPRELTRYVAVNTVRNVSTIPRMEFSQRSKAYSALVLLMLVCGSGLGFVQLVRERRVGGRRKPERGDAVGVLILFLYASASLCAIVMLVPIPRYWLTWIPVLYLWLAWSVGKILTRIEGRVPDKLVLAIAALVFGFPVFAGRASNQPQVYAVRGAMAGLDHVPVVAGNWVLPLTAFALKNQAVAVNMFDGLSVEGLQAGRYDMFVDDLEGTALWDKNRTFFERFVGSPERFGYRRLPLPGPAYSIFVRNR